LQAIPEIEKGWKIQPFSISVSPLCRGLEDLTASSNKLASLYRFRQIPHDGAAHHDLKETVFVYIPLGFNNLTNMAESRLYSNPASSKNQYPFCAFSIISRSLSD
jgi:hypothetical protein